MTVRVSDYIANHLKHIGVRTVFLLSGGGMMHLVDAVGRAGLRYICNHHEQASAMAADGYARQTSSLGVCYATSGPGATNILTGLVGAWQDSSPVLFLTGQSKVSQSIRASGIAGLRQFGAFEVDIVPIVQSVTKYAVFLDDPASVRYHLEKAIHIALNGRPGPVLIDVPLDVQGALIDPETLCGFDEPEPTQSFDSEALLEVCERVRSAARPLILAGYGIRCANATQAFRALAEKVGAPVVTTQLGKDVLPHDHPLFVGHPGPKGDRAGNFALQNADVIVSIGCSLHTLTTGFELDNFAPHAYKILVDPDPAVLQRECVGVATKIQCDVAAFINQWLGRAVSADARPAWRQRCEHWKTHFAVRREPHVINEGPVNFYEFADVLSEMLRGHETIVTDAGSAFYIMGQAFKVKDGQRYIVSGSLGSMGFALPAGLGVSAADPEIATVCVTGDGALHMNIHELQTLKHNQFNIKLFVIDNDGYVSIRNTQMGFFGPPYVGCSRDSGVSLPPLEGIAGVYGIPFIACEDRSRLRDAIEKTLNTPGPVICGIKAQTDQQIIPTVSSVRLPDGRMQSKPLHDMFPFLGANELRQNSYWT